MKAIFIPPGSSEYPKNNAGFIVLYENRAIIVFLIHVKFNINAKYMIGPLSVKDIFSYRFREIEWYKELLKKLQTNSGL